MVIETRKRTMEEFAEAVRDGIEALLGEGFIIRNAGNNIAPNIYLEY